MDQPQTINLDGVNYEVTQFSPAVQQAVAIHQRFVTELQDANVEVIKLKAALTTIINQLSDAVKKELADQAGKADW